MPTFSPLRAGGHAPAPRPDAVKTKNAQKMALFQTKNALAKAIRERSDSAMDVKQVNQEMKRLLHDNYYGPKAEGKPAGMTYHQALQSALDKIRSGNGRAQVVASAAHKKAPEEKVARAPTSSPSSSSSKRPAKRKKKVAAEGGGNAPSKVLSTVVPVHTRLVQSVDIEFR